MRIGKLWTAFILSLVLVAGVLAYDASTPYTVTMQWIVPSDTSFLVVLAGYLTNIDFNPTTDTEVNVEPTGQNVSLDIPMLNLYNSGNVEINFSNNLSAAIPTWALLMVNNDNETATYREFNVTPVLVEDNVAVASNVTVFLWTNVSSAVGGTTQRTYQIHAKAS